MRRAAFGVRPVCPQHHGSYRRSVRSFLGGEALEHAVQYFSWTNLQGALISLAIGAVLYFGVVRLLLMKKDAQGVRIYVDRWPRWADLEKLVYRPLLSGLAFVGAFCSRTVASLADWIIALVNMHADCP